MWPTRNSQNHLWTQNRHWKKQHEEQDCLGYLPASPNNTLSLIHAKCVYIKFYIRKHTVRAWAFRLAVQKPMYHSKVPVFNSWFQLLILDFFPKQAWNAVKMPQVIELLSPHGRFNLIPSLPSLTWYTSGDGENLGIELVDVSSVYVTLR